MIQFLTANRPIISHTTTTTTETLDGETILPAFPSTFMITVGAGAAITAGTTHGYGMPAGDGTLHTTAGAGDGTILGGIIVGAGADTTAGDTHTTVGAGPATLVGADITAGVDTTATTGAVHITTVVIMEETTPTCQDEEDILPVYLALQLHLGQTDTRPDLETIVDVPMARFLEIMAWPTEEVPMAIAIGPT